MERGRGRQRVSVGGAKDVEDEGAGFNLKTRQVQRHQPKIKRHHEIVVVVLVVVPLVVVRAVVVVVVVMQSERKKSKSQKTGGNGNRRAARSKGCRCHVTRSWQQRASCGLEWGGGRGKGWQLIKQRGKGRD